MHKQIHAKKMYLTECKKYDRNTTNGKIDKKGGMLLLQKQKHSRIQTLVIFGYLMTLANSKRFVSNYCR